MTKAFKVVLKTSKQLATIISIKVIKRKTSFNFMYHESVNASSDASVVSDAAGAHRVVGVGQIELVGYRRDSGTWTGKFCLVVIRGI